MSLRSRSLLMRESLPPNQVREAQLAALDAAIARGLNDAESGRTKPSSDVFDRLEASLVGESGRT
ncbi:type II toxin-antitoxin system ParD family antitoxin [Bradyrhizobium manausense]|uniref:type II toxin-antitoxin system ParD family antitoxin n=1 Tax=Bradyrhizobium manausense TaxID=989370 RepID=UPI0032E479CB